MAEDRVDSGGRKKSRKESENATENGYDDEPDFSDPPGYVDDVTEEELVGDLLRSKPQEADGIDSVIVVDNIPQVGQERVEKLKSVIRRIFSKFGRVVTEHYPEEDGKTKGYIFLEFESPNQAAEAVKATHGYKLDRQHTFDVNLFSEFDKYVNVPDEWEAPEPQPYKDTGNLYHWLMNADCNDQFSVIYEGGEKTAMMLNTTPEPSIVEERARWTETYVRWSPHGTYLATFHQKGIALWGGETFRQIMRFSHPGVQLIDFSPCERYLVTFSPIPDHRDEPMAIIIFDIRTGQKKRGFQCENASAWPIFKWTSDGRYFARATQDAISIYETPSFGLLEKKSMKIKNIRDFAWSPTDNYLAYWVPEEGDVPARVVLIEVPSRRELQVKNLFNVADCKMHWQKNGDYLCVKVDRYSKAIKKDKEPVKYAGMYHNFELFRIREKQIPVDVIECKETISAFAWEPVGSKFCFIHGESPRISASFYQIKPDKVELLRTLEKRIANSIFWSPAGQFVVLAGLRSMNGVLEFIDTTDMTVMSTGEHFMASDVEWDPTGRYVISSVSWWAHKVDNAYWVWNFQGRLIHKQALEKFCQLQWRPRPPSLLPPETLKEIKRNMKKYSSQFEVKDRMSQSKASKELVEKRQRLVEEYRKYRSTVEEFYNMQKPLRLELRQGIDTDEVHSHAEDIEEETIEFLVKVEETVIEE